ncbi:hypothetical protein HDV03_003706 [Kappamyces sp. JEL0829]|nr:hypothetical protein HDV03_003706 [Kappamyces sp. JEL0829]
MALYSNPRFSCSSCCPLFPKRNPPLFDYEEIDDLEFENLINSRGNGGGRAVGGAASPGSGGIWNGFAALFRSPTAGSTSIPTYDTTRYAPQPAPSTGLDDLGDLDELEPSAELLTPAQVSRITTTVLQEQNHSTPGLVVERLVPKEPARLVDPKTTQEMFDAMQDSLLHTAPSQHTHRADTSLGTYLAPKKPSSALSDPLDVKNLGQSLKSSLSNSRSQDRARSVTSNISSRLDDLDEDLRADLEKAERDLEEERQRREPDDEKFDPALLKQLTNM